MNCNANPIDMKRVAFLFGSGISRLSNAPGVCEITDALLNAGWCDDGNLHFSPSETKSIGTAQRAQDFLRVLKKYIDPHLRHRENRESHYEDLFSAAEQILQDETCEIVNPMIFGSVSEIQKLVMGLYHGQATDGCPNPFAFLVYSATLLIRWGVFNMLWPIKTSKGLEVLTSCAKEVMQMDIFSLNHDLLIERQLEQTGVPFSDGFSENRGDVLRFNSSWNNENRVRLYKLHGSLDWYPFVFSDSLLQFAKVPRNVDPHNCKDNNGDDLTPKNTVPLVLTGTTGKDRLYTVGFVGEVFRQFHARLNEHDTLICCGYGWKDKGINNYVNQWLHNSQNKRIIILNNGSLDKLKQTQYWSKHWTPCEQEKRVVVVPKWLSDCTLNDLEPFFDN
jgi:hypothetical protein